MPASEPRRTAAGADASYKSPAPGAGTRTTWLIAVACALIIVAALLLLAF